MLLQAVWLKTLNLMPEWKAKSNAAKLIERCGFTYDAEQDCMTTRMDAWQRGYGYCYAYDVAAPIAISAVIDCEPFFFEYNKKEWMIELWKGQYGTHTGCEIGVYNIIKRRHELDNTIGRRPHDSQNSIFLHAASDSDLLSLKMTLRRDGGEVFTRFSKAHWWLTGFRLGVYSKPEQLIMDVEISVSEKGMFEAIKKSILAVGYDVSEPESLTIALTFKKPFSKQPRLDPRMSSIVSEADMFCKELVSAYRELKLPSNDPNLLEGDEALSFVAYYRSHSPDALARGLLKTLNVLSFTTEEGERVLNEMFSDVVRSIPDALTEAGFKKTSGCCTIL